MTGLIHTLCAIAVVVAFLAIQLGTGQSVAHAQQLLAQVVAACGFADQSHLTQVFMQRLGCTPHACGGGSTGGAMS